MPSWGGAGSGAGAGAAIGSVVPGLGTAVGGGLGAVIGGLFGGKKHDDPHAAGVSGDEGGAKNGLATYDQITKAIAKHQAGATERSNKLGAEGDDALAQVSQYFKQLAGGDASAVMDATKQQRGRIIDQYDTARNAIANFDGRGGGATSASALSRIAQANQISDVTSEAQSTAADRLAALGLNLESLSLSSDQLASHDLDSLISAVLGSEQIEAGKSAQKSQTAAGLAQGLGTLLGLFLTREKAA